MTKKKLAGMMEWLRPAGIVLVFLGANYAGNDAITRFHLLGPFLVMLMSGTVAFESLVLGEAASEKIGYAPNRAYQIQSGLACLCVELGALCGCHHRCGNVVVLHFLGGKSCGHSHNGTEHETGQFNATGHDIAVDWLPAAPHD